VTQSNSTFNALDKLLVNVHAIKMPVGFGVSTCKSRLLEIMAHLKRGVVEVKDETNCLAHACLIAKARVDNDSNYKAYCDSRNRKILPAVCQLLETTGINLEEGEGLGSPN
jgi:hypothetical protein